MTNPLIKKIVVLTGAGISAESGVPVFRGADGLWEGQRVEDVATADAVTFNRPFVNKFFNKMRKGIADIKPNAAHDALVKLEQAFAPNFLLITQNIDPLHEKAGSKNLIHMHGELQRIRCDACGRGIPFFEDIPQDATCAVCGKEGGLRPDIVLFGETPMRMEDCIAALAACDMFIAIGTSGVVYPAAGFVDIANRAGAETVEINLNASERATAFAKHIFGKAGEILPTFVDECIERKAFG